MTGRAEPAAAGATDGPGSGLRAKVIRSFASIIGPPIAAPAADRLRRACWVRHAGGSPALCVPSVARYLAEGFAAGSGFLAARNLVRR
jgi:hypothetical protein